MKDRSDPKLTKLKYLTDGMLLREAVSDSMLSAYKIIKFDEAPERTLAKDILLGFLKGLLVKRFELKIAEIRSSPKFQRAFPTAPLIRVPGRTFLVKIYYTEEQVQDHVEAAVRAVLQIHEGEPKGDILVFLTGEDEIRGQRCSNLDCRWTLQSLLGATNSFILCIDFWKMQNGSASPAIDSPNQSTLPIDFLAFNCL